MHKSEKIKHIIAIIEECVEQPFELGVNDCNILVLRTLDVHLGTEYTKEAIGNYSTVAEGLEIFKSHGYESLEDLVKEHAELTDFPIVGDIMIDGLHASVCTNNALVVLDYDTKEFAIERITNQQETKKFYRVK